MPFEIIRNDIVRMETDAIVNAANSSLRPGGGVCGAIFRAAGYQALDDACREVGHCDVGSAVITPGFDLPAKYVIHAVGPIWQGGSRGEAKLLESCYKSAMALAEENGCDSIAFPLISAGIYGYPKEEALQIAVSAIRKYLETSELSVHLVLFDRDSFRLGEEKLGKIQKYIDERYTEKKLASGRFTTEASLWRKQAREQENLADYCIAAPMSMGAAPKKRKLQELVDNLDESFSRRLLRLIDEKGMTDVEVYKRANLDRKLFSKLRKDDYSPGKSTVLALAIALRLNLDETVDLLRCAGFGLSRSSKSDVIIEYFITEGIYDIYEVNEALFAFDQKLLGVGA